MRLKSFLLNKCILLILTTHLMGLEFGLDAKREGHIPIDRVQVFSERNSGSNYLQELVGRNFFLKEEWGYGHKHFPIWLQMPLERQRVSEEERFHNLYTFDNNEGCLFLVIFRDPYDWIRSMHLTPHGVIPSLCKNSFSDFIRKEWILDENNICVKEQRAINPLIDKDPATGANFKNVMRLRNAKNTTYLKIKDRVHNIYYINYETVRDHPKEVLEEIALLFNLNKRDVFIDVKEYRGKADNNLYAKRKYKSIYPNNLEHINAELDHKLEKKLGYEIKKFFVK